MRQFVPIKVKIGLGVVDTPKGKRKQHIYPKFNDMVAVKNSGMDWSEYVDIQGLGWQYDKCCGHAVDTPESPFGQQWGVLVVSKLFADEAVSMFPSEVTKLNEIGLIDFWDNHAYRHTPSEDVDESILNAIAIKKRLGLVLTPEQVDAIDPTTDSRGIRKNKRKRWADYKRVVNVVIIQ